MSDDIVLQFQEGQGPAGPPGEQGPQGSMVIQDILFDTTTARTLALGDAQCAIEMTSDSANTVTVPANADVAFPAKTQIGIAQAGNGQTTIVAAPGVTIKYRFTLKLAGKEAVATLIKIATNTWRLVGDTADS